VLLALLALGKAMHVPSLLQVQFNAGATADPILVQAPKATELETAISVVALTRQFK